MYLLLFFRENKWQSVTNVCVSVSVQESVSERAHAVHKHTPALERHREDYGMERVQPSHSSLPPPALASAPVTRWSSCRSSGFGPVSSGSSCVSRSASRCVNPAARLSSCAPCVIKRFPCSACWRVTWSATVWSRDTPAGTAGRASTTPSTWRDTWEHTPVRSRHSHSHQNNLSTHKIFTCHSFWKLTLKQQKHTPNLQPYTNSAFDSVFNFIKHNTTHSSLCNTHKSNRN